MYSYKITGISEKDNWIYIACNEKKDIFGNEPFIELVKEITKKWNDGEWKGNISSVGGMRYKVKNDPIDLTYQWDDLFGIVFEYTAIKELEKIKRFLFDNYKIN